MTLSNCLKIFQGSVSPASELNYGTSFIHTPKEKVKAQEADTHKTNAYQGKHLYKENIYITRAVALLAYQRKRTDNEHATDDHMHVSTKH